ncbi:hypothetical protein E5345_09450 [Propionibacterium sp. NM47_B9-13]|uniref:Uncharacterized protein n=1 Tax=Cutibacterium modestum HL044PA1 TaxID=765109 RepID=A0ABN0C6K9_9ACTN|nr:hypothetical protein HMPREF9607_00805 [Cutibacterium modestum HL044PA1]EFT15027.1 hypothetical protein HMPREF9622_01995 [Cutibacterium modestum HL037PA3]TGY28286.1 hypothetical protein E5345_09450 [Propionibacterium sp. NM47_B9-13]
MLTSCVTTLSTCTACSLSHTSNSSIERAENRERHDLANSGRASGGHQNQRHRTVSPRRGGTLATEHHPAAPTASREHAGRPDTGSRRPRRDRPPAQRGYGLCTRHRPSAGKPAAGTAARPVRDQMRERARPSLCPSRTLVHETRAPPDNPRRCSCAPAPHQPRRRRIPHPHARPGTRAGRLPGRYPQSPGSLVRVPAPLPRPRRTPRKPRHLEPPTTRSDRMDFPCRNAVYLRNHHHGDASQHLPHGHVRADDPTALL